VGRIALLLRRAAGRPSGQEELPFLFLPYQHPFLHYLSEQGKKRYFSFLCFKSLLLGWWNWLDLWAAVSPEFKMVGLGLHYT
jgi:hypothetical protein